MPSYGVQRTDRKQDIVATAGQTVFGPLSFDLLEPADLRIERQVENGIFEPVTDFYQVAGAPGFPTVTFEFGRENEELMRFKAARLDARLSDITLGGAVRSAPLEAEQQRFTKISQEVRRDVDQAATGLLAERTARRAGDDAVDAKITALSLGQALVQAANQAEAEAGEDNGKWMTPLRVFQQIATKAVRLAEAGLQTMAGGLRLNFVDSAFGILRVEKFLTSASSAGTFDHSAGIQAALDAFTADSRWRVLQGPGRKLAIAQMLVVRQPLGMTAQYQGRTIRDLILVQHSDKDPDLPMLEVHDPFNSFDQSFLQNIQFEDTNAPRQMAGLVLANFYGSTLVDCTALGLHGVCFDERRVIYPVAMNRVWEPGTVYLVGEVVTFETAKEHVCIRSHRSGASLAIDTAAGKWGRCMGAWSAETAYSFGDCVSNGANSYYCHSAVGPTAAAPAADTAHWVQFANSTPRPNTADVFVRAGSGNHGFRARGLYVKAHQTSTALAARTAIGLRLASPDWEVFNYDSNWCRHAAVVLAGAGRLYGGHHSMGAQSFFSDALKFCQPNSLDIRCEIDFGGITIQGFGNLSTAGTEAAFTHITLDVNCQTSTWADAAQETFLRLIPGVAATVVNNLTGDVFGKNDAGGDPIAPIAAVTGAGPAANGSFSTAAGGIRNARLNGGGENCASVSTMPQARFTHAGGAGAAGVFTCDLASRLIANLGVIQQVQATAEVAVAGAMSAQVRSKTGSAVKVQVGAAATGPNAALTIHVAADINAEAAIAIATAGTS